MNGTPLTLVLVGLAAFAGVGRRGSRALPTPTTQEDGGSCGAVGSAARVPSYVQISSDLFRESGCNVTDPDKVTRYAAAMRRAGGWGRFPPISGQVATLDESDLQDYEDASEGGFEHELAWSRPLTRADLGRDYVVIEDGHHRAYAARLGGYPLRVKPFTWGKGVWPYAQIKRWWKENP